MTQACACSAASGENSRDNLAARVLDSLQIDSLIGKVLEHKP